ncbi:MAG: adenylosuccinate lyase, partial [Anaerolineae bacterium]|nr:adenylosuccinate lyase [Anaerolineae bacterium]
FELEAELRHDVMAEIHTYAEQCKVGGWIIHLGATSMDVLDNADALRLRMALELIAHRTKRLLHLLGDLIERWAEVPTMAFTHLQPAEPTTVGYRLAFYAQDLLMDWQALKALDIRGKGIKGAVGTSASYAALLKDSSMTAAQLEARVMDILGLPFFEIATQTYPRKQDWLTGNVLAGLAGSLYKLAFDVRFLQSIGEWSEPFGKKQVGSSAMPFKRNPIKSENLDSLGRWAAAQVQVLWDNAAHSLLERTLDDSANRREVLPSMFLAVEEMLIQAEGLLAGLTIHEQRIERHLKDYGPFAAVENLLMLLAKAGADRQNMHEVLREHSLHAWQIIQQGGTNPLPDLLTSDEKLRQYLSQAQIQEAMQVEGYVGNAPERARSLAQKIRVE